MSHDRLLLSQYKLATFLACQRRFQLRYLRHLPWPNSPLPEHTERSLQQGQAFHQLLERHFLGLRIDSAAIADIQVKQWWQQFESQSPIKLQTKKARFLPEAGLTVPLGEHLLYGRFDLLVIGRDEQNQPFAHIFDWKTGRPIPASELNDRWQTRLYLALLAEGGRAFWPEDIRLLPEQISLTYWFVQDAGAPVTIGYSTGEHEANWKKLEQHAAQLQEALQAYGADEQWPLTEDWSHCRECAYQSFCGRQEAGTAQPELSEEAEEPDIPDAKRLAPELP